MELEKIPGFTRARDRGREIEDSLRIAPFLPLYEKICGIEVVPLTLRIILRLTAARSPFFAGNAIPKGGDVVAFLWAVSPGYSLEGEEKEKAKEALLEKARTLPYRQALRAVRRYLYYAYMDRPPASRRKGGPSAPVTFAAAICHHIAAAYGWDDETILDKPLRRLYQYIAMIRIDGSESGRAVTFNPIVDRLTKPIREKAFNVRNS